MSTNISQQGWAKTALRLPRELHQQVHTAAKAENRSFNSQIVTLLREGILSRDRQQTQGAA